MSKLREVNTNAGKFSVVKFTTDYDIFTVDTKDNRDVKKFNQLVDDVKVNGISIPIIVSDDHTVIDGQHRLDVAESLGIPVPYMISFGLTVKDASRLNSKRKSWGLGDYLKFNINQGKSAYILIDEMSRQYPLFSVGFVLLASGSGFTNKQFKDGKVEFTPANVEQMSRVLELTYELCLTSAKSSRIFKQQKLLPTLMKAYDKAVYNHSRLLDKVSSAKGQRDLHSVSSPEDAAVMIRSIYNRGLSSGKLEL